MSWTSISHAYSYWRGNRELIDPPTNLDDAEAFILGELPATTEDAACILDVVWANHGDVRCDGLDHAALGRICAYLVKRGR